MEDTLDALETEVRRRVTDLGYDVVDVRLRGTPRRPLLQVRVDFPDSRPGHGVTHDDCAAVSRALERWLDEAGPLGERYVLEVSSPGIERPVRWAEHWARFRGHDVKVRLEGRGRIRATIVDVIDDGHTVVLRPVGQEATVTVPLPQARDATLVVDWPQRSTNKE